jgi:uncharacterized protein
VGSRTPDEVAAAVVKGIERDLMEVDVAPLSVRWGAKMAGVAPGFSAKLQRRLGGDEIAENLARGQADKR